MNIYITKLGNIIKCKNDYDIKYFNVYKSFYKIRGNLIIIYSTGNNPENYTFAYDVINDNITYSPSSSLPLTTVEEHADYLATVFFLNNNINIQNNIINPNEYYIYENDFLSQNNINIAFGLSHGAFLKDFIFRNMSFSNVLSIGNPSLNSPSYFNIENELSNGKYGICLNRNHNSYAVNVNRILFSPNISRTSINTEHRMTETISKNTRRIIMTFIFKLHFTGVNQWAQKHNGTQLINLFIGFNTLYYSHNIGNQYPYNSLTLNNIIFMYSTNSSLNPTNNIMFNLYNTKYDTGIDFVNEIANSTNETRIDIILKNDNGNSVLVEFYLNNVLRYTYLISGSNYNNLPNYFPFIYVEQNGLGSSIDTFSIIFDYFLFAYNKSNNTYLNKGFNYYNNKL